MPRLLLRWASQLIKHGSTDQPHGQHPKEHVPSANASFVTHSFTPFSKKQASGFLS